jgi:uncharacterized Zn-finger protein
MPTLLTCHSHHTRYHYRRHVCEHQGCGRRFGTKTHLDRHINDKHTKSRHYFCTQHNCPYSKQGGKSFPRKDNWRRHMQNKHNITNPPDPEEMSIADEAVMEGTAQPYHLEHFALQQAQAQAGTVYDQAYTQWNAANQAPREGATISGYNLM